MRGRYGIKRGVMMRLFISSAEEDANVVAEITGRLGQPGVEICSRKCEDAAHRHSGSDVEDLIAQADAFLAVVSADFVSSAPCRREQVLALHQEGLRTSTGQQRFIHVLRIRPTRYDSVGDLRGRPWVELTAERGWDAAIDELRTTLPPAVGTSATPAALRRRRAPRFHNRENELDRVLDGLTSPGGQRFWLVIAPPQLGKSWFLDRISTDINERQPGKWRVKLVDLRDKSPEVRDSPEALLGMLFGRDDQVGTDQDSLRGLATGLVDEGKFHLCLLDSAELLSEQSAETLRKCLSDVHERVKSAAYKDVELCLIVASRQDARWLGVKPRPRLRTLRLTEFTWEIVATALQEMASRLRHSFSAAEVEAHARSIHQQCEGLPALLHEYLDWVQVQRFIELHRLEHNRLFVEITVPYIEKRLLSRDSLFRLVAQPTAEQRDSMLRTLFLLAPYRLLSQAHVSEHAGPGGALEPFVAQGWTVEKLWRALGQTDLLIRPQRETWEAIPPPIRRLLCRYWHRSDDSLAFAHYKAGQFTHRWGSGQPGTEKAVALVECIWHRTLVLKLSREVNAAGKLIEFAGQLSGELSGSDGLTQEELRARAAHALDDDEELAEAAADIDVTLDQLNNAVRMP
jgi:hypothetical protein